MTACGPDVRIMVPSQFRESRNDREVPRGGSEK